MSLVSAMHAPAIWAFECLDLEEAEALARETPGSFIEVREMPAGEMIILWVPQEADDDLRQ